MGCCTAMTAQNGSSSRYTVCLRRQRAIALGASAILVHGHVRAIHVFPSGSVMTAPLPTVQNTFRRSPETRLRTFIIHDLTGQTRLYTENTHRQDTGNTAMAQSNTENPQLSPAIKLVNMVQSISDKYPSMLSLCNDVGPEYVHNGSIVKLAAELDDAQVVLESAALAADTDLTFSRVAMEETKLGNRVSYSLEWENDSISAARDRLAHSIVKSHQRASDAIVLAKLASSVDIPVATVASLAALTLDDLYNAMGGLRYNGMLPAIYAPYNVYADIKSKEVASGVLSDPTDLLGHTYVPLSSPPPTVSGSLVCYVGDLPAEMVCSRKPLRVNVDTESSVSGALNGMASVFSWERFSLGLSGSGLDLVRIELA